MAMFRVSNLNIGTVQSHLIPDTVRTGTTRQVRGNVLLLCSEARAAATTTTLSRPQTMLLGAGIAKAAVECTSGRKHGMLASEVQTKMKAE